MVPEEFPLLQAASRQSARFDEAVRILAGGLQAGSIRNKVLSHAKDTLSRVVESGWTRYVSEPFFYGGKYETQSQLVNDLNRSIMMMGLHNVIATHRKLGRTKAQGEAVEAMRAYIAEALPLAEAVIMLKKNVVMGRAPSTAPAKPVNPDKVVKTCACCFRGIAVANVTMAHHGYTRPGTGWQTASCPGVRFKPLEVSSDGLKWMVDTLKSSLKDLERMFETRDSRATLYVRDSRGGEAAAISKVSPRWARAFEQYVRDLESQIASYRLEIPQLEERLRNWRPEVLEAPLDNELSDKTVVGHIAATAQLQKLSDFQPGDHVRWEWQLDGSFGKLAVENGIRPVGMVVDRKMRPNMAVAIGIEVLDDPLWVIDPAFALTKGIPFRRVEELVVEIQPGLES